MLNIAVGLDELKEWIRIDGEDEDNTLKSLISTSRILIKQSTGVDLDNVKSNTEAIELYKTLQKFIITDLYENRNNAGKTNPILVSLYAQLEVYKLKRYFNEYRKNE